ncbi:MAG: ATP-binding cassette domain-containing protein [Anaerolineae bacterium]|nr:ATP-binding cassette domain-containing protein [Anaerolineae bacterium]
MRVELQDIHKAFGQVHANDGISLALEPGRIYGLLGENGAGKSTLMKILSGYQLPTSGTIRLDDHAISFSSPSDALRQGIGMLYQDPLDFPALLAVENFQLAYQDNLLLDLKSGAEQLRTHGARFGFAIDPHAYVDTLTLGERQQAELIRLLSLGAEVLILDEPTTGISAEQKEVLFDTMRHLAHDEQKTIILVSHKLEEVQQLCDEVAVLRRGKLMGTKPVPCPTGDLVRLMFGEEIARTQKQSFNAGECVLKLDNITSCSEELSIEDISLEIREGEVLGLAGLEGSGQQILLQACAGLLPVSNGTVLLDNIPLEGKSSVFSRIPKLAPAVLIVGFAWSLIRLLSQQIMGLHFAGGITISLLLAGLIWLIGTVLAAWSEQSPYHAFQQRGGAYVPAGRLEEGLIAELSLTEHMALAAATHTFIIDWEKHRAEISGRIQQYSIVGRPATLVDELSGGNQQRAMLALLNQPLRLLLLEHPTRGLDVTSANWVWELFQERRREGTAIMFMSSDLDELFEHSDRVAVFSSGAMSRILKTEETSVDELGHLIGGHRLLTD